MGNVEVPEGLANGDSDPVSGPRTPVTVPGPTPETEPDSLRMMADDEPVPVPWPLPDERPGPLVDWAKRDGGRDRASAGDEGDGKGEADAPSVHGCESWVADGAGLPESAAGGPTRCGGPTAPRRL